MSHETPQIGAYFYPLTNRALSRNVEEAARAHSVGLEYGIDFAAWNLSEFELIRDALPLFEGHQPPARYCLPEVTPNSAPRTEWDDGETLTLAAQLDLAIASGLSYFIFNTYEGARGPVKDSERGDALRGIRKLSGYGGLNGFKYAKMEILESPRAILPIPVAGTREGFGNGFRERYRRFDLSEASARHIVDYSLADWQSPDYLFVKGRPYLSVLTPSYPTIRTERLQGALNRFVDALRTAANQAGYEPYLVGVMRDQWSAPSSNWEDVLLVDETQYNNYRLWLLAGADAVTQYCDLPTHGPTSSALQTYEQALADRQKDWQGLQQERSSYKKQIPFIPSPAVGWNASARGQLSQPAVRPRDPDTLARLWEQNKDKHPYRPIVIDGSPALFLQALESALAFTKRHVPADEQLVTIFAWNEISEGAALLPRLRPDGSLDYGYLDAVGKAALKAQNYVS